VARGIAVTAPFARLTWPRQTARLSFRPATADDLRAVFEIRSRVEVGRWMPERPTSYPEFVLRFGELDVLGRTLVIELDGAVIGDLYLKLADAWAQADTADRAGEEAEIGWCLSPAHQRQGYVSEAAAELVRTCFEDLGVRRISAAAFADNLASVRIMEKLGMRRETHGVRDSLHRDLGWVDGVVYALLAEEWRAQHARVGPPPR
jgi:RimJ/RimL family protein N-acetyltransferase